MFNQFIDNNKDIIDKLRTILVSRQYYWYHASFLILIEILFNFVIIKKINCKTNKKIFYIYVYILFFIMNFLTKLLSIIYLTFQTHFK